MMTDTLAERRPMLSGGGRLATRRETLDASFAVSVSAGLPARVVAEDLGVAHRFAGDIEAGDVGVNDASRYLLDAACGGVKTSGIGRRSAGEICAPSLSPRTST